MLLLLLQLQLLQHQLVLLLLQPEGLLAHQLLKLGAGLVLQLG